MNSLDILFTTIIIYTTLIGLWKGLTKQFLGLGGVITGYILSVNLYEPIANFLGNEDSGFARIVSFICLFSLGKSAVSFGVWRMKSLLKHSDFSRINRISGASLGLIKGLLISMIITIILLAFMPARSGLLINSSTLPYIASLPNISSGIIPKEIRKRYNNTVEKLQSGWEKRQENMSSEP